MMKTFMKSIPMHVYEVRPRKDKRGVDLISDVLPFGRLWYDTPDNAIGYAMHSSRSHDTVIRVCDDAGNVRLLLVEYSHVYEAFAARGDGARLSIGRYNTLSGERNLSIFLDRYFQRVVTTKFFVRPRVSPRRVTGDWIVFPVELARPHIVCRLTVLIGTVLGDFHLVSDSFKDNRVILRRPRRELRFSLV